VRPATVTLRERGVTRTRTDASAHVRLAISVVPCLSVSLIETLQRLTL
jgi:hypothetical protein